MNLPEPSLMANPATQAVRERWIGKKIRIHRKHLNYIPESEAELNQRNRWIEMGTGTILDVGKAMWFKVKWNDGTIEDIHKSDIEREEKD